MAHSLRTIVFVLLITLSLATAPVPVSAQSTLAQLYSLLDQLNQQRQKLEHLIASLGSTLPVAQAATSLITSTSQCPSTSPALTLGAGGKNAPTYIVNQVTRIQRYLITRGYLASGNDTGYFGTVTAAAITQFQKANSKTYGLSTSGTADKKTLEVMRNECLAYVDSLKTSTVLSTTTSTLPTTATSTPVATSTKVTTKAVSAENTPVTIAPVPTTGVVPVNETAVWTQQGTLLSGYSLEQPMILYDPTDTVNPYKLWMYAWASTICNQNLHISAHACDAIFHAVSSDGVSWRVYTGDVNGVPQFTAGSPETWKPVIHAGVGPYDDTHAGDPHVIKIGNTYFMAYSIAGSDLDGKWSSESGDADGFAEAIGGAVSTDGVHWTLRSTPLLEYPGSLGKPDPVVGGGFARPSLMYENGIFKLWYDYVGVSGTADAGYAQLTGAGDTNTFLNGSFSIVRGGSNPVMKNWPNPSVVKIGSQYFMYGDPVILMPTGTTKEEQSWTSRTVAEAVSNDGLNWVLRGYVDRPSGCGSILMPEPYTLNNNLYLSFSCQKGGSPYDANFYQIRRMYRSLDTTLPTPSAPNLSLLVNGSSGTVTVTAGQNVNVSWSVGNTIACTLVEETDTGSRTTASVTSFNGSWMRTPLQSVTYRMSCVSIGYTTTSSPNYVSSKEVRVQVSAPQNSPPPPTVSLTTSASSIAAGQSVSVNWSSQNANVCTLLETVSGGQQSGLSGSWTRTPPSTTNYNLQCYNSAWQGAGDTTNIVSAVRTVTVTPVSTPAPPPATPAPTATLSVNGRSDAVVITAGESVQVNWSSQNTASCIVLETLTNATQTGLSGTWNRTPAQTTNYAIQCVNSSWTGSGDTQNIIQKSVLVTVNPAPVLTCSATPDYVSIPAGSTSFTATVTNAGNASSLAAGVWSQTGGQDDIRWYYGVSQGNGTWSIAVDPRNHPTSASDQVVYIASYLNPGVSPTFCDYASYTKPPN